MTLPFISLSDLGLFLGQDLSQSALGVIAIDSACEAIRTDLNQTVNLVTDDVVRLDGTGRQALLLPQLPVRSVSSVLTSPDDDDELELEETDYVIGEAGILWRSSRYAHWPMGHRNIEVTYTHGWDMTEDVQEDPDAPGVDTIVHVPSDIRMVALQFASEVLISNRVGVGGVTSETIGEYSYTLGDSTIRTGTLSQAHRDVLARYRVDP